MGRMWDGGDLRAAGGTAQTTRSPCTPAAAPCQRCVIYIMGRIYIHIWVAYGYIYIIYDICGSYMGIYDICMGRT